ncbi:MAG: pyridoxine 5'-phosphate synthase [Devosiaceae bacterium]|nr:pyridoxine 5'-phosphate synthase [Devosiaceae bacterium MH13]
MPTELSVNVNAIAYLRNRRDLPWPSIIDLCRICLDAGAVGITVHPRPDERHIRATDVEAIAALLAEPAYKGRELNIEGYPDERFLALCEASSPDQVTLVPDDPAQATSDHGWEVLEHYAMLGEVCQRIRAMGARPALFVDADPTQMDPAERVGADRVELYTGPYGHTFDPEAKAAELAKLVEAAQAADTAGLGVNAGHDLTLDNLPPLVRAAPMIAEASIGHALTADALTHGYAEAVRLYRKACGQAV